MYKEAIYKALESLKTHLVALSNQLSMDKKQIEAMVRRVCAQEGMNYAQIELIVAVIWAESAMNPKAIGRPNRDGTRDYGLCQFNDKWWIGPGKKFASVEEVLNNPEKCVRVMCWRVKQKNGIKDWSAFNNGSYQKFIKP